MIGISEKEKKKKKEWNWWTLQCTELIPPKYKADLKINSTDFQDTVTILFKCTIKLKCSLYTRYHKSRWDTNLSAIINELRWAEKITSNFD